ncbi:MAG: choline ABC transporter ATP-binding protein [Aestuariivirga sp.]
MTTAVEFRNVDIIFGDKTATALSMLDAGKSRADILAATGSVLGAAGASLQVREGEISVLMGLSGSGKSTLLRAVNGLNKVTRGEVLVNHKGRMVDVVSCSAEELRDVRQHAVAMVFQQFALLPWRTVAENAGFGLELAGVPDEERKARVDKQLKLVGLENWAGKYVHELSGGMQQRVGLARAFATEAPILLMDEPFSALDPLIRTKLQDELLQLQKELKKTIVFVSHDLEEALKLGNTITIMEGGRIVQSGRPEDIVLRPANDYVRDFIANVNPLSVLTAWNVMRATHELATDKGGWILARPPQDHPLQAGAGQPRHRGGARRRPRKLDFLRRGGQGLRPQDQARVLGHARHLAQNRHAGHAPLGNGPRCPLQRGQHLCRRHRRQRRAAGGAETPGLGP